MSTATHGARAGWRDAFDAQMSLWSWLRSPTGREWWSQHFMRNAADLEHRQTRELIANLYGAEYGKLEVSDPVYVSGEMCEVIGAASESFEPEPLYRTDLLTDTGFVFFSEPFTVLDRFDEPTTIAGFSWVPMLAHDNDEQKKRSEAALRQGDDEAADLFLKQWRESEGHNGDGIGLTIYARVEPEHWPDGIGTLPPLVPMHVTPWYFEMSFDGNEVDTRGAKTASIWWWRIVQTTLRLMQQRISVRHHERPQRPDRRTAKRLKFPEREVLVVRLRRERGERKEGESEPGNYSHRWIVGAHSGGFWRNQWFPASQVHRQIWISPFVQGPSDKPLVIKPRRAFQWDR